MERTLGLAELIEKELGAAVTIRENPLISSVGTTATRLLRLSSSRVALIVVNLSTVNMYLGWFDNVSPTRSIVLSAGGGNVLVWWKEDYNLPGREWYIIADAAASPLFCTEFTMLHPIGEV